MQGGINATRMELLRHRRRLALARRGHHLLKGKQDELLRRFLARLEAYLRARRDLDEAMGALADRSRALRTEVSGETIRIAAWPPASPAVLEQRPSQVLNIQVPVRELRRGAPAPSYAPDQLPAAYDQLAALWMEVLPLMVEVANLESLLTILAEEIERTRRRVNALEHKLIPGLEEGIKSITFRLAEAEMGNLTRLMRVKEIVRGS